MEKILLKIKAIKRMLFLLRKSSTNPSDYNTYVDLERLVKEVENYLLDMEAKNGK